MKAQLLKNKHGMPRIAALMLVAILSCIGTKAFAYDFSAENEDGVTIYYNFIENGVEVAIGNGRWGYYSGDINIPASVKYGIGTFPVTRIGLEAFIVCKNLTSVTIPNSVESIGKWAFVDCVNLETLTIGNGVKIIEESAFGGCSKLASITIPESVEDIGAGAFGGLNSLTSVTIPGSVKRIDDSGFVRCINLETVIISYGVPSIDARVFSSCYKLTRVEIPNSVKSIGEYAFFECISLESITIPESVTCIGDSAFKTCENLKVVNSLIQEPFEISSHTFTEATLVDGTLYVPKGTKEKYVATEGWKEFKNIEELFDESSEDEDTSEPDIAVDNKDGVSINFNYGEDTQEVTVTKGDYSGDVTIPETIEYEGETLRVTSIGEGAFADCTSLTSVTIPNSVVSIGSSAFAGCIGLTSATIGGNLKSEGNSEGVKEIGNKAFYGCSNLESVTIPSSVTSIGEGAFGDCNRLDSVVSHIQEPFAINDNVFSHDTKYYGTLFVPEGTKGNYQTTQGWKEFSNIDDGTSTGIEDIKAEDISVQSVDGALHINGAKDGTRVVVYSMTGAMIGSGNVSGGTTTIPTGLRKGEVAIVRVGNTAVKVVMQ